MPEGDTLARTARTLGTWLAGREITAARAQRSDIPTSSIIGTKVETVEARGKHLFMRLSSGLVLRTHMKMTGSWHVYPAGARWRKPAHQARLVLEAGDRVAVCFNVPVIELVHERDEHVHPATKNLGPDVLVQPVDLDEVRRRAATRPPDLPVCELLLDQQVVCGIGNIWRAESMFACGVDPMTPQSEAPLDDLVNAATRLMSASVAARAAPPPMNVYGRTGKPCKRCRTPVQSRVTGENARRLYWCPGCQTSPSRSGQRKGED
ncbi:MAG TPA: DNA-formamidopyrimidine glycosylase family protein [Acidimicrobiales bacterium]|nr:DNA-formamidopyrimidine glycosylase family protein [Acidimicrobiales bacterium]